MKKLQEKQKNILLLITGILFVVCLAFFLYKDNLYYTDDHQNDIDNFAYTNIWKEQEIKQHFYSSVNELESIQIQFGNYQKKITGKEIKLTLKDEKENTLQTSTIMSDEIKDNQFIKFSFEKIQNSKGKKYIMQLQCEKCTEEEQLAIYGKKSVDAKEFVFVSKTKFDYQTSMILTGKTNFNIGIWGSCVGVLLISFILFYRNIKEKEKQTQSIKKDIIFFTLEFILSLGIIFFLYKVLYILNYKYDFSIFDLFGALVTSELLLLEVAYILKAQKIKIEQFFLLVAIPIGICYLVFIPPTYVADEIVHYTSAYKITNGEWKDTGDYVKAPAAIIQNGYPKLNSYQQLNGLLLERPNDEFSLSTASGYNIINYLPSTIGIFSGRVLHVSYYIGFYLGRILTLITSLILGYLSIKYIPIGKFLLCIYLLNPMFLQQAMAISADAITNSICIFYISYLLYISQKEKTITTQDKVILSILMFVIAALKYTYIPLVGLILLLLYKKKMSKKDKITMISIMIASMILCVLFFCLHSMVPTKVVNAWVEDNHIGLLDQLMYLLKQPISIIKVLRNTLVDRGTFYYETFLGGHLGWLNIEINRVIINIYALLLVLSPFMIKEKKNYKKEEKIGMSIIFIGVFLLILFGMYLTWTTVGADIIEGVQGRYFLPIMILPLLLLCDKERYVKFKNPKLLSFIIILFVHIQVLSTIISKFL